MVKIKYWTKNNLKIEKNNLPLVIGYFGCVHVMHNQLLTLHHRFNVLTFTNMPHKSGHQIYDFKTRIVNLKKYQPENIYIFDIIRNNMTAKQFVEKYLLPLNPSEILVGADFKFGSDCKSIMDFKHLFKIRFIPYIKEISTSIIYDLLKQGNIELANDYLAANYFSIGKWIGGKKIGRKLGFPTINVATKWIPVLKAGAYVTRTTVGTKTFNSVSFVYNHTPNSHNALVETHILGVRIPPKFFYLPIFRNHIKIEYLKFLRSPIKVLDYEQLKPLIANDVESAKKYFLEFK